MSIETRVMKRISNWIMVAMALSSVASAATLPSYRNTTTVTNPQVDAVAFDNAGNLLSFDPTFFGLPFQTFNTSFYTNRAGANLDGATLSGSVGFDFHLITNGGNFPASNFVNQGTISAAIRVLVNANTITNQNSVLVSPGGLIRLTGKSINLSNGRLAAGGSRAAPYARGIAASRYTNPVGVTDLYWGTGINDLLGNIDEAEGTTLPLNQISSLPPQSPGHWVIDPSIGTSNLVSVPRFHSAYVAHVHTNNGTGGPGNRPFIQVVFVPADLDSNLTTTVRFAGFGRARTAIVEFAVPDVDITTLQPITNFVYLLDRTALVTTNNDFSTNLVFGHYQTYRPNVYEITRTTPFEWFGATGTNGDYSSSLLFNPGPFPGTYTSNRPVGFYSGYAAQIGAPLSFRGNPTFQPTNSSGRVEIVTDQLNLTSTRIRSENMLSIVASNVVGTSNSLFDAPFINYNLITSNQTLVLDSLVTNTVKRLTGQVYAWSAFWTNQIRGTNIFPEFAVLIVDHNLSSSLTVQTGNLAVKATNLVINDAFNPQVAMSLDSRNLTINGSLNLSAIGDVGNGNFPNLSCFTNNGLISSSHTLRLGSDTVLPLAKIQNSGAISADSIQLRSISFENNGGSLDSGQGTFQLDAQTAKISNSSSISSGVELLLQANDLLISGSSLSSGGVITLTITNSVRDGDGTVTNSWNSPSGIQLTRKPTTGDLLNSRITLSPLIFGYASCAWVGQDKGRTVAGFSNNTAVGHLVLDGGIGSVFAFSGVGSSNAIYVDYLELRNDATNYLTSLDINPDFILYFADSNIPADKLDNSFNGRLRWVKSYAGSISGTNITLPPRFGETVGATITVNRSLLSNSSLDSDADGMNNFTDPSPFDGVMINPPVVTASNIILSWTAAAQTVYRVECSTNFMAPTTGTWMAIADVTNNATITTNLSYADALSHSNCVYRINYMPSGQFP